MSTATALLPNDQLTDEEIVRRVVDGDTALFEILMRRHNQRVYRAVRAVLRSDDDVEDAMQQAYLDAYRNLRQFAGNAQFSTWLTRIAVNEALARLRKRGRAFGTGEDEVIARIESSRPSPEQEAVTSELRRVVETEIEALPDTYRLVLVLRDVEGLSTAEAAETLAVTEDVVKTRLHRARTMLRDNLYRRAGVGLDAVFTFGNARCDRVVGRVMAAIG